MKTSRNDRAVRRTARKKWLTGIIAAVVTVCIAVGGTIAFLTDWTKPITNTFQMSTVDVDIDEKLDGSIKKDVAVTNNSDVPIYVRVRFVTYWEKLGEDGKGTGEIVADVNGENPPLPFDEGSETEPGTVRGDWLKIGDYFYYTKPVNAKGSTSNLFDKFRLIVDKENNRQQVLEVFAEGIQSLPVEAVETVWPDVVVQDGVDNGTLVEAH